MPLRASTSPLKYPNGSAIVDATGAQVYAVDPQYLGPTIVAHQESPGARQVHQLLPTGAAGNLFLPVDTTIMGAGHGAERRRLHAEPRRPFTFTAV